MVKKIEYIHTKEIKCTHLVVPVQNTRESFVYIVVRYKILKIYVPCGDNIKFALNETLWWDNSVNEIVNNNISLSVLNHNFHTIL